MYTERHPMRRNHARMFLMAVLMSGLARGPTLAEEGGNPQETAAPANAAARDPEGILNLDIEQLARTPVAVGSGIAMNER